MLHDGKFYIKLGLPSGNAFPTAPAPEEGDVFYREDEDKVYAYDGADWNHIGKGVPAADVINVPAGDIAATDVQAAIDELDAEKGFVAGCHGASYPVTNQTIAAGATYTSGDLRDGTVVPSDAVGLWLMVYGACSIAGGFLGIDSADDVPDAYSSRVHSQVIGQDTEAMVMVRLGTGGNAGKIKIKALAGNWTTVYAWPVGWWR